MKVAAEAEGTTARGAVQKIVPHLRFDKEAKQAAKLYTSLLPDSAVTNVTTLRDTPSGDADVVSFHVAGQPFMAISAGPLFRFNPSVSFVISCSTNEEVDALWRKLSKGGKVLMELGAYPFSERYGWLQDRYGLSWQINHAGGHRIRQKVTPMLLFVGKVCGRAEEAINFYASVFRDAKTQVVARHGKGEAPEREGTVKYAQLHLFGQEFGVMDSAHAHDFAFNEAISFMVNCETQKEIDDYWKKLSAVPEAEQCGWLKDKYGVSWQIVPNDMGRMMSQGTPEQISRITKAFLPMKKFDIAALRKAYDGR